VACDPIGVVAERRARNAERGAQSAERRARNAERGARITEHGPRRVAAASPGAGPGHRDYAERAYSTYVTPLSNARLIRRVNGIAAAPGFADVAPGRAAAAPMSGMPSPSTSGLTLSR